MEAVTTPNKRGNSSLYRHMKTDICLSIYLSHLRLYFVNRSGLSLKKSIDIYQEFWENTKTFKKNHLSLYLYRILTRLLIGKGEDGIEYHLCTCIGELLVHCLVILFANLIIVNSVKTEMWVG